MCPGPVGLAPNDVCHDVSGKVVLFLWGSGFVVLLTGRFGWK